MSAQSAGQVGRPSPAALLRRPAGVHCCQEALRTDVVLGAVSTRSMTQGFALFQFQPPARHLPALQDSAPITSFKLATREKGDWRGKAHRHWCSERN
jgi:hypothetical protein